MTKDSAQKSLLTVGSRYIAAFFISAAACVAAATGQTVDKKAMAEQVRTEFKHSWDGYKQYCWGHDDLKPISKTCRDWYGQTILMTPADALDSLYVLGFKDEADKTREYIAKNLSFDKDIEVQ